MITQRVLEQYVQFRSALNVQQTRPILAALAAGFVAAEDAAMLDEMSNRVAALVREGKLDEAERAAHDLLERFPGVHDGYDRLGMVFEARGDPKTAASYYRKVIEFAREHPGRPRQGCAGSRAHGRDGEQARCYLPCSAALATGLKSNLPLPSW